MKPEFCLCKAITEPIENVFFPNLKFWSVSSRSDRMMSAAEYRIWSLDSKQTIFMNKKKKKKKKASLLPPSPKYFGVFSIDNQYICQR